MWSIVGNPTVRKYAIWLTNFTDYSWYSSSYSPFTTQATLNFGDVDSYYYGSGSPSISIPSQAGNNTYRLSSFGFGLTNKTASPYTQYYSSLLNTYEEYYGTRYDPWANSSIFTTDFKGLGLPSLQYYKFADLLAVLTEGESSCVWRTGGVCTL